MSDAPSPTGGLAVRSLTAGYRRRPVIEALTLPPVEAGHVTALVGPNAAGKTTLLRALAGLLPAKGSVALDGRELLGLPAARHAAFVTYMPQALPQRVALTVLEATISALRASPVPGIEGDAAAARRRAAATLDRLGIGDLALASLDELSGGQRQLASLAQALAREPAVLLLDEPTSALDLHHQFRVMTLLREVARERGIVAMAVLHDLSLAARHADRVMVMARGALAAAGRPEAALTPAVLADVYHVAARVEPCTRAHPQIIVDGLTGG